MFEYGFNFAEIFAYAQNLEESMTPRSQAQKCHLQRGVASAVLMTERSQTSFLQLFNRLSLQIKESVFTERIGGGGQKFRKILDF